MVVPGCARGKENTGREVVSPPGREMMIDLVFFAALLSGADLAPTTYYYCCFSFLCLASGGGHGGRGESDRGGRGEGGAPFYIVVIFKSEIEQLKR